MKTRLLWWVLLLSASGCSTEEAAPPPPPGVSGGVFGGLGSGGVGVPSAGAEGGPGTGGVAATPPPGSGGNLPPPSSGTGGLQQPPTEGGAQAPGQCTTPGLELDGLMYSPGGTLLPFPCEPFHPTLNNPYAVRCIDAWSWYETQFPGDEYCILPPEPGKGLQFGVHPQGRDWYAQVSTGDLSGYANPSDEFVMSPGEEEERNYVTSSSNDAPVTYYRSYVRMRAGSHHMILSASAAGARQREAWTTGSSIEGLFGGTSLPGAQRPDENVPKSLDKPPEDAGLYSQLGADQDVVFNMHHFNSTEQITLKEAWENLWFEEDATIRVVPMFGMPITQPLTTFATPGQTVDIHGSWTIGQEIRLLQLFGHRHVWTSNFSAWIERGAGGEELLYQSFDWFDQPTYRYDNTTQNPVPAPDKGLDGGASGVQILNAGDKLHFNCHMNFTDERAAVEGAPSPASIGPLRFANQAFQAEMCILFGSTAATPLGQPVADPAPVPSFATAE